MTAHPRRPLSLALVALALVGLVAAHPAGDAWAKKAKKSKSRSAAKAKAPVLPKTVRVAIFHTTDLHGHMRAWDYATGKPIDDYGLSKIATLVRRERADTTVKTLLVDAGDCIQGSPLSDLHDTGVVGKDRIDPQMACMNALGYDAMTIGNHEYNFGLAVLEKARSEAKFPWLSANTQKLEPAGAGAYQAYEVKVVNGVRIGILGLTTGGVPTWEDPDNYAGLRFDDPLESAKHFVPILRNMEHCDAVVIVAHMGLEEDDRGKPRPDAAPNENRVLAIARQVPGVDAIVMGHTHTVVESRTESGVLLTQAGRWGEALGKLSFTFERRPDGKGYTIAEKKAAILDVEGVPEDPAIVKIVATDHDATEAALARVIGTAADTLSSADGRLRDNALLDLVHRTQLDFGQADVSLAALFSTRVRIPPGPITVRDVFSIYPYENTLAVLELSGKDLKDALEHSAKYYTGYDFGRSRAPFVDPNIPGYNFDVAGGVDYVLDLTQPFGKRVQGLTWRGSPVDPSRKFRVAVNNYRVNGGGGYAMYQGKPVLSRSGRPIRDLLVEEIGKSGAVKNAPDGNWRMIPSWAGESAAARAPLELLVRRGIVPADSALAWGPGAPLTRARYGAWLDKVGGGKAKALVVTEDSKARLKTKDPRVRAGIPSAGVNADLARVTARAALPEDIAPRFNGMQAGAWDSPAPALTVGEGARVFADVFFPRVTILETTDFHGQLLDGMRDRSSNRAIGSAAVLASYVARERTLNPTRTILVDGGDWSQGTPISNLNFGRPVIEMMNRIGVDAAAIGNHEFDWGVDTLLARIRQAKFQPLGANWIDRATNRRHPGIAPWTIVDRDGMRIGIVGLLTDETASVTLPQNVKAFEFVAGGPLARAFADSARAAGADFVVVVGHLPGSTDSTNTVKGELADVAKAVSDKSSGVVAVLGGHSHNRLQGTVEGLPVIISGAQGGTLGRIDLVIDRRTHRPVPEETRTQLITTFADDVKPDAAMASFVTETNREFLPVISRVLGRAPEPMRRDRNAESAIGDWVADVMREASGSTFAFQNPGGLRADVDSGAVTVEDVYQVMPFDNQIATVELTGAQVLDVLEHGFGGGSAMQISGLSLAYDSGRPRGERVLEVTLPDGKRIDPGATYKVAVNDFMAQGGDGFTMLARGKNLTVTGVLVRDALMKDVTARTAAGRPLAAPAPGRIVNRSAKASNATAEGAARR